MDYRLEQLRFQIREDPSSRIFFKLGEHLRREGELDEAVEILERGLEEHPTYVSAWVSLGRALIDRGDSAAASTALQKALELDPENAVAARYAGEAAIANREWVEAIKSLKRARAMSPQDESLDERIALVEAELAEMGLLEAPEPAQEPARTADAVFAVEPGDKDEESAEAGDVFAGDEIGEEAPSELDSNEVEAPIESDEVFIDADVVTEEAGESVFIDADADEPDGDEPVFEVADGQAEVVRDPVAWVDDAVASDDVSRETVQIALDELPFSVVTDDEVADVIEDSQEEVSDPDPDQEPDPDAVPDPEPETVFASEAVSEPETDPEEPFETAFEPDFEAPEYEEPSSEPDAGVESVFEQMDEEPEFEAEPEPVPETEFEPVDEPTSEEPSTGPESDFSSVVETVPIEKFSPDDLIDEDSGAETDIDEPMAEDVPLPTMTLARLAMEQGDSDLAATTLRGLIDREPDNDDAKRLLADLQTGSPAENSPEDIPGDSLDGRARALRGWLEAVRLASEKLKS